MSERTRRVWLIAAVVAAFGVLAIAWMLSERRIAAERPLPQGSAAEPSAAEPGPSDDPGVAPGEPRRWAAADWVLVDGALPDDLGPLFRVDGLTAMGDDFVAWGRVPMPGRNQFNDMGAVLTSVDGHAWRVTAIDHGVNPLSASTVSGVAGRPGGYLAFGSVCCDPEAPAVWHSTDLVGWTRLTLEIEADPPEFFPSALVGGPAGWIAVGSSRDGTQGQIWSSDDGASWELVMSVDAGPPGMTVADVAVTPDGLIAVGTVTDAAGTYDGAAWRSPDGHTWERVGGDDPALVGEGETQFASVVAHANGIYVTGIRGTTEDRKACEAITMAAPIELGPPPPAVSCGWGTEHAWVSEDGTAWERIDPAQVAGEQPIEFRLIAAGGPGMVLLGESSGPDSPDTTLFTSADGRAWAPVAPPEPLGNGVAMGLAVRGDQVVAVADHSDDGLSRFRVWVATAR